MKGTVIPCNDAWFFVGKGTHDEAIIYQVALWLHSEDNVITGLIGETSSNERAPGLIGVPPDCVESGYYPAKALTSSAIDKAYCGKTLPYKEAFKRFSSPKEVKL